jgi:hypothetical protein
MFCDINADLNKYLSVNNLIVKADLSDTRGATAWTIGKAQIEL